MRKRLGQISTQLWQFLRSLFSLFWRFVGRVGIALRNLLRWFVYYPLFFITMPFWLPARWVLDAVLAAIPYVWRFVGRVGLAIRRLLHLFVWRPFHFLIIRPLRWGYKRLLFPAFLLTKRSLVWGWVLFVRGVTAVWRWSEPFRRKHGRPYLSKWRVAKAKLWVRLKRPSAPQNAEFAPRQPRVYMHSNRRVRWATAVAAIALILTVALLSMQERQNTVVAETITIVLTPTPLPATPSPVPTLSVVLTPWATPDPTTGGGAIVFSQHLNGNSDIYVLPIGQSEPVRMTTDPAADRDPVWSPDGRKIAFASRRSGNWDIYVYDVPRGELTQITRDKAFDGGPTWSPDSQWLAYESYKNGNLDIYLIKGDRSQGPIQLTYDSVAEYSPVWSPSGRHIAYTSWQTGNPDIYLRSLNDAEGEFVLNVTESPAVYEDGAAFSPDGRFLAYYDESAGFPVVRARPLTPDYTFAGEAINLNLQGKEPTWSPDSQSFVAVYDRAPFSYLVAGTQEAFGVVPQMFVSQGQISSPSWTAVNLSPDLANNLRYIDGDLQDEPLFVEALAQPKRGEPITNLFELDVNAPSPYLSDQVDQSFVALRQRVLGEAGWDFLGQLDGMFEAIDTQPLPNQSAKSWSKAGRAFDLYYREALGFEPRVEVVRVDVGNETYWRVFVKTAVQDGSLGEPMRALSWDFQARSGEDPRYYEQGGKWKEALPAGYYLDFTALAADYGWEWNPANSGWRTYFPDIRFWQYTNRQEQNWEEAMLTLYSEQEIIELFGP